LSQDLFQVPDSTDALVAALRERDWPTQQHSDRVCRLTRDLGRACGLQKTELRQLHFAARFHDIGKIGVPDSVLLKQGRLDAREWEVMCAHSEQGERIFRMTGLADAGVISQAIRGHHEAFDGSGYPDGLSGERIPLLSRLIRLADSYDAMADERPHQRKRPHAQIMGILREERGSKHDPRLFDLFAELIENHPARVA